MRTRTIDSWVCPDVSMYHDKGDKNLITEIELPGVKKEDITLETGQEGFCVKAKRDNISYDSCYNFAHRVNAGKTRAEFINGLLRLRIPLSQETFHARKVEVM